MATDMKYCRKCGTGNRREARFCETCGTQFTATGTGQTTAPVRQQMPTRSTATIETLRTGNAKQTRVTSSGHSTAPKKSGKKWIALVTAAAVFAVTGFGYPGFLRDKKEPGNSPSVVLPQNGIGGWYEPDVEFDNSYENAYIDADSIEMVNLAEGTLTKEDRTISEGGVTVSVADGFMGTAAERGIEINKASEQVNYRLDQETEVPLTIYEVNIDGIHEHSLLTIELPMDKDAAPLYGAGYIDEETGRVRPALNEYDPKTGILTIHTTHLTKFCGIPIRDEKTKYASLGFISGWELLSEEIPAQEDYRPLLELMEKSLKNNGDKISTGLSMMDYLSIGQGTASAGVSMGTVPDTSFVMQGAPGLSAGIDGAGTKIYMTGNGGVMGYSIDPSTGTSKVQGLSSKFGWQNQRTVAYDDKLKVKYPSSKIESLGKHLNRAGHALTLLRLCQGIYRDGFQSKGVAAEATKWAANGVMEMYVKYGTYTAGLGIYMTGVGLFAIALDYVYTTALNGRKQAYISAYKKYYESEDGYWDDDTFIAKFREVLGRGGNGEETKQGIVSVVDDYVREFWKQADWTSDKFIASVLTKDDRAAWGIAAQAGLTQEIVNEISDNHKANVVTKRLPGIFEKMNYQMQAELAEKYNEEIEEMREQWNQDVVLYISSPDRHSNYVDKSKYAGCVVRFKGLGDKVKDPEKWETVLNGDGEGTIKFTLFAHMYAEVGNEIEVLRIKDGKEQVIHTGTILFKDDSLWGFYAVYGLPAIKEETETETEKAPVMWPEDPETETEKAPAVEPGGPEAEAEYAWVLVDTLTCSTDVSAFSEWWPNYASATPGHHDLLSKMIDPEGKRSTQATFVATCDIPPSILYAGDKVSLNLSVECTSQSWYAFWGDAYVRWDPAGLVDTGTTYGGPKFQSSEGDRNFQAVSRDGETYDGAVVSLEIPEGSEGATHSIYFCALRSNTEWRYEWRQVGN